MKLKSVLGAAAVFAAMASPVANAATANISLTLLPYTVADLNPTDNYSALAPDFENSSVGYRYVVQNGSRTHGLSYSSPVGPAPLHTPLGSGPFNETVHYSDAQLSLSSDGVGQANIASELDVHGFVDATVSLHVPVIVNPYTSISLTTRAAIDMFYDPPNIGSGLSGTAYSATVAILLDADGMAVGSYQPASFVSDTGAWTIFRASSFTNNTDQPVELHYYFATTSALWRESPAPLPVPEPATYAMFAVGALVLMGARRRKSA